MTDPCFVVQKHKATRLHYDFRLEIEGVLKSWAVPKGPSMGPSIKRLAVMVEDHPLDYRDFEGAVAEGEYGAGAVVIWDEGSVTWEGEKGPVRMLEGGFLEFSLHGSKLKGRFKLINAKLGGNVANWLLIKRRDEFAEDEDDLLTREPDSARTGRSLLDIADDTA